MSNLVKSIMEKNYTEAERLFNARIEAIAESKMREMKKMIMAKESVNYPDNDATVQKILGKIGK